MTAAVTRTPALATTLTSTPNPRAAIDTVVSRLAVVASGASIACGINPNERKAATIRKPRMNHGTSSCSAGPERFAALISPEPVRGSGGRRRLIRDRPSTTGPSISTRTSLTTVPTWLLSAPIGSVAARTCGTA